MAAQGGVPRLHYNSDASRYEGSDGEVSVVINASAFEYQISRYLREHDREDTDRERQSVRQVLLTVAHWRGYEGKGEGISVIPMFRSSREREQR